MSHRLLGFGPMLVINISCSILGSYLGLDPSRHYSITSLTHCKVKLFSLNS